MKIKRILSILLIIITLSLSFTTVFAAENDVEYNNAYNYIFKLDPHEDLFKNFKDIMPGAHKTQVIALQNTEKNKNITIYMRAETFEEYKEFLDYMTLKIYKSDTIDGAKTLLSENTASETGALDKDIKLVTLAPGQKCYITVILDVDINMGNSQSLKNGMIRWIFSCDEEIITPPATQPTKKPGHKPGNNGKDPSSPNTGNNYFKGIAFAVSGIVISAFIIIILLKNKKKDDNVHKPTL